MNGTNMQNRRDGPLDIPTNPRVIYMNKGWVGFGDWLGTGRIASKDFEHPL